jgi:hypothetical protein
MKSASAWLRATGSPHVWDPQGGAEKRKNPCEGRYTFLHRIPSQTN